MMTSPCVADGCGVHLEVVGDVLTGNLVPAPLPCNAFECIDGFGAYVLKPESRAQAGTVPRCLPPAPCGWSIDLNTAPVGVPIEVSSPPYSTFGPMPTETFTNESLCLAENVMTVVTAREVQYAGVLGAWFTVQFQEDRDGGGFVDMFNMTSDYQFVATGFPLLDARSGGASSGALVLAPGAFFTYRYRIILTNLAVVAPGAIVTSPGLTFGHLSVTN